MKDDEILDSSKRYSKVLRIIDAKIKFKKAKEEDNTEIIKKEIFMKKKEKHLKYMKNLRHENIIQSLKKFEKENQKNMENKLNQMTLTSALNRIIALPKVSKYKKDNKNNKVNNMIKFEKIWREQSLNDAKYKKKINTNKLILDGIYYNDIFDVNYDKYRKHLEETKEKNRRIERVKSNNLKVIKKLEKHHKLMLRFQDHREYKPNYSVIEKHKPEVKIGAKSKRIIIKNLNEMIGPNISMPNSKTNILSNSSKIKKNWSQKIVFNKSQEYIYDNNYKINKRIAPLSAFNIKSDKINNNILNNFNNNKTRFSNKRKKSRNIFSICGTSLSYNLSNLF
jgi:hypothetical protein